MGTTCTSCGEELEIGDYPFCPHGSIYSANATTFSPVALDRKLVNGEYVFSYPGSNADPVSPGYERIHLTSLRAIDAHSKSQSGKEQELRSLHLNAEKAVWDQRVKERREATRDLIRQKGFQGKYFDAVCQLVDRHREKKHRELVGKQVSFHNQAFSFDRSNRQEYHDQTIGKRDR